MTAPPSSGVPFATADTPGDLYPETFCLRARKGEVADKTGAGEPFAQAVYAANLAANQQNLAQSKARNNGATPYATLSQDQAAAAGAGNTPKEFHLQHLIKELPAKIGTPGMFDTDVYRQSLAANQALHEALKHKQHGSAASAGGLAGNSGSSCPFATVGAEETREAWRRSNYTARVRAGDRGMADKVGASLTFDPATYQNNIDLNRQQQADSITRNYIGSGHDLLAFQPGTLPVPRGGGGKRVAAAASQRPF